MYRACRHQPRKSPLKINASYPPKYECFTWTQSLTGEKLGITLSTVSKTCGLRQLQFFKKSVSLRNVSPLGIHNLEFVCPLV